jgi:hypothetical protein
MDRRDVEMWVIGVLAVGFTVMCLWIAGQALVTHFKTIDCCRGVFCPPEKLCKPGAK